MTTIIARRSSIGDTARVGARVASVASAVEASKDSTRRRA